MNNYSNNHQVNNNVALTDTDNQRLQEKTIHRLRQVLSQVTGLSVERIEPDVRLEHYGIDSMAITRMNQLLRHHFDRLPKTLLFEYQTVNELSQYLLSEYRRQCLNWVGHIAVDQAIQSAATDHPEAAPLTLTSMHEHASTGHSRFATTASGNDDSPSQPSGTQSAVQTPLQSARPTDIAIIGVHGQFPLASSLEAYWQVLKNGQDCIAEIPAVRWPVAGFYEADPHAAVAAQKSYGKWGGFLEGFAEFDPLFFNISPQEAINMDPQERLFLQASWTVLEQAGYSRQRLADCCQHNVGVYAGVTKTGYSLYAETLQRLGENLAPRTSFGSIANRVSYALDLNGPSMPIDTMCSSSLTAIHEACESIIRGECVMAIAGGVNLYLHPQTYVDMSALRMLSTDGKCRSFGAGGNGYVPGEGVGVVLLKQLPQALADHDPVHAVIRASQVNHGGRTSGYSVPNPKAQAALIHRALEKAGIPARAVSYIEAHGTGTELGDPIEVSGLTQAFRQHTDDIGFCALGSAKSNIGHLEAAAGVAGLIKVILQLRHQQLVPSLHAQTLNPNIDLDDSPFVVQTTLQPWARPAVQQDGQQIEYPRIAGISSFGAGGANAHIVVSEYPAMAVTPNLPQVDEQRPALILLSARHPEALQQIVSNLLTYLADINRAELNLHQLAYTLQVGREAMNERLALMVTSVAELTDKLHGFLRTENDFEGVFHGQVQRDKEAVALFNADEDFQETLSKWLDHGKFSKLLSLWSKGLEIHWQRQYWDMLFPQQTFTMLELPTYPFTRDQYWIPASARETAVQSPLRDTHPNVSVDTHVNGLLRDTHSNTSVDTHVNGLLRDTHSNASVGTHVNNLLRDTHSNASVDTHVNGLSRDTHSNVSVDTHVNGLLRDTHSNASVDTHVNGLLRNASVDTHVNGLSRDTHSNVGVELSSVETDKPPQTWLLQPVWEVISPPLQAEPWPGADAAVIVMGGTAAQHEAIWKTYPDCHVVQTGQASVAEISTALSPLLPIQHIVWLAPDGAPQSLGEERIIDEQQQGILALFRLIKALQALDAGGRELGLTVMTFQAQQVLPGEIVNPVHAGIHGLCGCLAKEYPNWRVRLLDLPEGTDLAAVEGLWCLPARADGDAWAWRRQEWLQQQLLPVVEQNSDRPEVYRDQGVYVVIGGAGGLGEVFSRELIQRCNGRVVWIGRRPLDADIQSRIDALATLGHAPVYIRADATDLTELQHAGAEIKSRFGAIHGIVHSALGSYDQSLSAMDEAQFQSVLAAKVDVCVRIAQVFAGEVLDFVLFFSSLASFGKGRGMGSYAAGCTFKDAFAARLGQQWSCDSKVMNWGFWSIGGGARISTALRNRIEQSQGIVPITAAEGMAALDVLMTRPTRQLATVRTRQPGQLANTRLDESILLPARSEPAGLPAISIQTALPKSPDGEPELNEWIVRLFLTRLWQAGVLRGDSESLIGLRQQAGVLDKYEIWWHELLLELRRRGYIELQADDTCVCLTDKLTLSEADRIAQQWGQQKAHLQQDPDLAGLVSIVDDCAQQLLPLLRGERLITDILFPGGSTARMEPLYKDNTISRYFNDVLTETAVAWIENKLRQKPQNTFRILEIGAGTGGTTSVLLPALAGFQAHISEYCYTDLSDSFLQQAQARYGDRYPFLRYQRLNIEQPLTGQNIDTGGYDLVIATNVLHATRSMRNTLRQAKSALRENGLLLLNEMTDKTVFATLIFGLIDGWSLAQDQALRIPGSPGLTPQSWRMLLDSEGFEPVLMPVPEAQSLAQQIIAAQSDGVIRLQGAVESAPLLPATVPETPAPTIAVEDAGAVMRQLVLDCLATTLRLSADAINVTIPFSDYGLDSILGANFINQLSERLNTRLNTTLIFDHTTTERLSRYLSKHHQLPSAAVAKPASQASASIIQATATPADQDQKAAIQAANPAAIAVVGMSGQFPGAENIDQFWDNLMARRSCVSELPESYLPAQDYAPGREPGKSYCRWGGVLENRACFDPLFFNLSPRDAESMNPHQRLVLQESWRALEHAGYNPRSLAESLTSVFVGSEPNGYIHETFTGSSEAIIASRLSYFLNLRGPTLVVNTGCSSSAVALHLACENLRHGESDMALAGGVFAAIRKSILVTLSQTEMLSYSGVCSSFDDRADGMVMSEGVGMVVLRRLADAERAGDHIYGVITASGMNQDGASNGITAPSGEAQEQLIVDVYRRYGIDPERISFVETHGTGTRLGDPIEVNALTRAFRQFTDKQHFCALGSGKTMIGHTAASAGVIGLIKVLLSLHHRQLPGLMNFQRLNPQIELEPSAFYLHTESRPWLSQDDQPLMAALSSFGHSGTNVHMVIQEYQDQRQVTDLATPVLVPLSAVDPDRLREQVQQLLHWLRTDDARTDGATISLPNLAYTLQLGREAMRTRAAFVVESREQLITQLQQWLDQPASGQAAATADNVNAGQLSACLQQGRLDRVADAWCQGADIDWSPAYQGRTMLRLGLPTYPFAKEHYWQDQAFCDNRSTLPSVPTQAVSAPAGAPVELLIAGRCWQNKAAATVTPAALTDHRILLCDVVVDQRAALQQSLPGADIEVIETSAGQAIDQRYRDLTVQLFEDIRQWLLTRPKSQRLLQVFISSADHQTWARGLSGLLKTARLENPLLVPQLIDLCGHESTLSLPQLALENARTPADDLIRYGRLDEQSVRRQVAAWDEWQPSAIAPMPWKHRGVYLITGGVGGLGMIFAEEICRRVNRPALILIGRSELDDQARRQLDRLRQLGAELEYHPLDISRREAVERLFSDIRQRHGDLNGILHSAGVHRDNYILTKPTAEIDQVLAAKVAGTVHLDAVQGNRALDFFVLFSSGSAVAGNPGQADYAAANGFMDSFAADRQQQVALGQRQGLTVAIDWPLWQRGGMQVDGVTQTAMAARTGMQAMPTAVGIQAFYQVLASDCAHVCVVTGDLARIRSQLAGRSESTETTFSVPVPAGADLREQTADLREQTVMALKRLLGASLKLSVERISSQEPLERYGVDSIVIMDLNNEFASVFGDISKTLLYEYQTLSELADYLIEVYPQQCHQWTGLTTAPVARKPAPIPAPAMTAVQQTGDIAIIGLAGHYPQADQLQDLWQLLKEGRDCITEIPPERWSLTGFFEPDAQTAVAEGRSYGKWGSFLADFAGFDAAFFQISPREAMCMDPQERLFLQCAWETFEDAGYGRERRAATVDNQIGVFVGITKTGYDLYGEAWRQHKKQLYPNTSFASVANRVSYQLNLHGPSMPIDTMCSSSLTAIHEACERLRRGDCKMALAGGVNLYLHANNFIELSVLKMLSKDGKCRSFGDGGDGYVPGEGVGAVLLKPLTQAEADQDRIYGVIRASAVNHGGKTNGYTVPNPVAQGALIQRTLAQAGLSARMINYVEAHGTGTALGDPIEVTGLTQAYRQHTQDSGYCALASVKSNLGHLEAAAGILGLTKILLQLRHQQIAPSLHSSTLNRNIDFTRTPFFVPQQCLPWSRVTLNVDGQPQEYPRTAALSSFGAGGANAHLIVSEYQPALPTPPQQTVTVPVMIVLSARTEERLTAYARRLSVTLQECSHDDLHNIAYTLQVGRDAMDERLAFMADTPADCARMLTDWLAGHSQPLYRGRVNRETEQPVAELTTDDYSSLLQSWVQGALVDWDALYLNGRPRITAVPVYPFVGETFWLSAQTHSQPNTSPLHSTIPVAAPSTTTVTPSHQASRKTSMTTPDDTARISRFGDQSAKPVKLKLQPLSVNSAISTPLPQAENPRPRQSLPDQASATTVPGLGILPTLVNTLAEVLYMPPEQVSLEQSFVELGLDSIVGVEWVNTLNKTFGLHMPSTQVYDYPNLRAFAAWLTTELGAVKPTTPAPQAAVTATVTAATTATAARAVSPPVQTHVDSHAIEQTLVTTLSEVLYMQPQQVNREQSFVELGLDSIVGVEWVNMLNKAFGLSMPSTQVYDYPNLRAFANWLTAELATGEKPAPVATASVAAVAASVTTTAAVTRTITPPAQNRADQSAIEQTLVNTLAEVLYMQPQQVNREQSFVELGLDSIVGVEWVNTLNKTFGLHMPSTQVYDYPNLRAFAAWLTTELGTVNKTASVSQAAVAATATTATATQAVTPPAQNRADQSAIEQTLVNTLAEVLYMQPQQVNRDQSFVELGLDSIVGVEWVNTLNKTFGLHMPSTQVYDYPNLRAFAAWLVGQLAGHMASITRTPEQAKPPAEAIAPVVRDSRPAPAAKPAIATQGAAVSERQPSRFGAIAIIGMSGRYPDAGQLSDYWDNLRNGRNSVREVPRERWDADALYDPDTTEEGRINCKWLGALDDIDCFDPLFFMISPGEAENIDPQHRLFLQESYRAFEDAGYSPEALSQQKCGVYMGIMSYEYAFVASRSNTGNSFSIGAARVPYFLNLKGPAIALDTACSSSLVATHLACQALNNGETDLALSGGVSLYLASQTYVAMCQAGMLSVAGQCKTFDDQADGFVPGEGVGVLVLKRLQDAERDNDHIYGLIVGSGINQDGRTNGITAPSMNSQVELHQDVYQRCGIDPRSISYIEAHGTGTRLGDPIELRALSRVYGEAGVQPQSCAIGSVKTNIGHSSAAAGVASVHKVLLAMQHKTLVPSLNFNTPNRNFDLGQSPFYVNTEVKDWVSPAGQPRRAAVSAFGFSGTNAHLVLEEYIEPAIAPAADPHEPRAIVLSARTEDRLRQVVQQLQQYLQAHPQTNLEALAYTLQLGREAMAERAGWIVDSVGELLQSLNSYLEQGGRQASCYRGQVSQQNSLLDDNSDAATIARWMQQRRYDRLLNLWVQGAAINWRSLYDERPPKRLSLPGYPFERRRCWVSSPRWIDRQALAPEAVSVPVAGAQPSASSEWLVAEEHWQPEALNIATDSWLSRVRARQNHQILIVSDQPGDVQPMQQALKQLADAAGDSYLSWQVGHAGISTLADAISADDAPLTVFCLTAAQDMALSDWMFCAVSTIMTVARKRTVRFYGCVSGENELYRDALSGLFRSATLESTGHRYRLIATPAHQVLEPALALQLIQEWLGDDTDSWPVARIPVVKYQGSQRQRLQLQELTAPPLPDPASSGHFRTGATYLMVGALGDTGEQLCLALGRHYQARLVILSRRSEAEVEPVLQRIRASGARVLYRSVDILDREALQRVMDKLHQEGIFLQGVIHLARQVCNGPITEKSLQTFHEVIAAKVTGSLNIDAVTANQPLDFFLMYSSLAAFGLAGSADYAFACAFQNALALHRHERVAKGQRHGLSRSLCWGQWAVDGAVSDAQLTDRLHQLKRRGIDSIDAESALQAMVFSLQSPHCVLALLPVSDPLKARTVIGWDTPVATPFSAMDIDAAIQAFSAGEWDQSRFAAYLNELADDALSESQQQRILSLIQSRQNIAETSSAPVPADLTATLQQAAQKVLKLSAAELDWDQPLSIYGMDSIVAMQLATTLERALNISVKPGWLIEYPTLNQFAGRLAEATRMSEAAL
ncbi:SDR family NAD(P)-dependent oxidoreductase [Gynuella sunshinyii]|uniref:PKS n=1 Tax=Gynuella sunshinyii YC6258 TaxID=1445510 RepID=A0A0C5VXD9_9GAMM|nr:SDR family NAD(P)-dependent oxidoreductase [Gynuella sunshinyii]AJQ95099.1 polyketide synthase modules-related protein [Gynuella sunshinyii YC6258]DAC80074.1 TPA_exp: PKS [Gynuella sunshinyii YC6258]